MPKPEWGKRRKCLNCGTVFYDFRKENPKCPKCGEIFEEKAVLEKLSKEEDDIPEDDDLVLEDIKDDEDDDSGKDAEYTELDVEEDLQNIDPNLVNDDDIDNVFIEDKEDVSEMADELEDRLVLDEEEI